MLNLQGRDRSGCIIGNSAAPDLPQMTSLRFRLSSSFIGNMGEPIDYLQSERRMYEDGGDDAASIPTTLVREDAYPASKIYVRCYTSVMASSYACPDKGIYEPNLEAAHDSCSDIIEVTVMLQSFGEYTPR